MTDISELVQRIEYAAHEEIMCRDASDQSDLWVDIITPENILALTAALEKAQARIAELEARTVKLPTKFNVPAHFTESERREAMGVNRGIDECAEAMTAAGIKWESE